MNSPLPDEPPFLGQNCVSPYSRGELVRHRLWNLVQATIFRASFEKMHRWRAWLLRLFGADIPDIARVVVFPSARIYFPWKLTLEPRSMVGRNVNIYNLDRIVLKRGANVSQNSHLCAGSHDFYRWEMPLVTAEITLGENVWLGADVFVGPGVSIGELSVVGARSVVVTNLPSNRICVGNPCRAIKRRSPPTYPT